MTAVKRARRYLQRHVQKLFLPTTADFLPILPCAEHRSRLNITHLPCAIFFARIMSCAGSGLGTHSTCTWFLEVPWPHCMISHLSTSWCAIVNLWLMYYWCMQSFSDCNCNGNIAWNCETFCMMSCMPRNCAKILSSLMTADFHPTVPCAEHRSRLNITNLPCATFFARIMSWVGSGFGADSSSTFAIFVSLNCNYIYCMDCCYLPFTIQKCLKYNLPGPWLRRYIDFQLELYTVFIGTIFGSFPAWGCNC